MNGEFCWLACGDLGELQAKSLQSKLIENAVRGDNRIGAGVTDDEPSMSLPVHMLIHGFLGSLPQCYANTVNVYDAFPSCPLLHCLLDPKGTSLPRMKMKASIVSGLNAPARIHHPRRCRCRQFCLQVTSTCATFYPVRLVSEIRLALMLLMLLVIHLMQVTRTALPVFGTHVMLNLCYAAIGLLANSIIQIVCRLSEVALLS